MSSNNLSIEDCDSLDISSEALSNKETQTSSTYITDSFDLVKGPSRPLPKGIDKSNIESTHNNILDCRVLKDPSDSKSTEPETDSFVKDIVNSNESIDEETESPTFLKYCKEIAEPYLKTHFNECEDNIESLEKLIQDALEDIPDYQPCFEVYEGKKDIEDKINETATSIMDTIPDNINIQKEETTNSSPSNKTAPEAPEASEKTDDQSIPKSVPANTNIMKSDAAEVNITEDDNETNKDIEINRSVSIETISQCIKESLTAIKQSASTCLDKLELVIGVKKPENPDEKPTYYAIEEPKVDVNPSHNVQTEIGNSLNSLKKLLNNPSEKIATFTGACKDFAENLINNNEKISAVKESCKGFAENLMNNHNEKISAVKDTCKEFAESLLNNPDEKINAIKESCKDYADKFYTSSKEAVTLLKSESAKFLTKSESELNNDDSNENQHRQKEKKLRHINAESVTSFLFKKAKNMPVNDDDPKNKAITGTSRITDAIPPTVKLGFKKLEDDLVTSRFDKSSPYDKTMPQEAVAKPKPPDIPETRMPTVSAIDHNPDPPAPSNVFEMIRSKIFSIFLDEGEKAPEPAIQETHDDDEEDPFERFMEQ